MKKKLSALIAAALCVTVGGVYATWQYAEDGAKEATADLAIGISSIGASTTKGSISLDKTGITASIDHDLRGTAESAALYKAYLLWSTDTAVDVTFTKAVSNTTESEIKMSCTLSENYGTYTYTYNGQSYEVDLFRFKAPTNDVDTAGNDTENVAWEDCKDTITFELNGANACSTTTIDLSEFLVLNPALQVPTSALHKALSSYLLSAERDIEIKVFETPANV